MNRYLVVVASVAAFFSPGCATLNSPEAQANAAAQAQQCKLVEYHSASEVLRTQNQRGVPGTDMEKTEGKLDIGNAKFRSNPALRDSRVVTQSIPTRLQLDC
jgi:hypothetical protein